MQCRLGPYVCFLLVFGFKGRINHPRVFIVCVGLLIRSSVSMIERSQRNLCRGIVASSVDQAKSGRPASAYEIVAFRLGERCRTRRCAAVVNNYFSWR